MSVGPELVEQIAVLLREAGRAHHAAFATSGGEDPDWPAWYARYLREALGRILVAAFNERELADLLMLADRDHRARAPDADWPVHYAKFCLERSGRNTPGRAEP